MIRGYGSRLWFAALLHSCGLSLDTSHIIYARDRKALDHARASVKSELARFGINCHYLGPSSLKSVVVKVNIVTLVEELFVQHWRV